jgi:hypothetical protein
MAWSPQNKVKRAKQIIYAALRVLALRPGEIELNGRTPCSGVFVPAGHCADPLARMPAGMNVSSAAIC